MSHLRGMSQWTHCWSREQGTRRDKWKKWSIQCFFCRVRKHFRSPTKSSLSSLLNESWTRWSTCDIVTEYNGQIHFTVYLSLVSCRSCHCDHGRHPASQPAPSSVQDHSQSFRALISSSFSESISRRSQVSHRSFNNSTVSLSTDRGKTKRRETIQL